MNFARAQRGQFLSTRIQNFCAAGHRFESFQKPLGRTCLHIHSVIRTALHLAHHRSQDEPGRLAKDFLKWVTTERCVLMAMMSDAADECMQLTRLMDVESSDPASLRHEISTWLAKLNALFVHGACVTSFGYTSTMLQVLKTPLLWNLGSTCYSIGGEDGVMQAVIDRCLTRMFLISNPAPVLV